MERVVHKLQLGDTKQLTVFAADRYSRNIVAAEPGQQYHIRYQQGKRWVDLIIPATAAGYKNPLADLFGQRLKGINCFCLCATFNDNDNYAFPIGLEHTFTTSLAGSLTFFANDVPGYDWNNWGSIEIIVSRLK
jgi:hypothetical protein